MIFEKRILGELTINDVFFPHAHLIIHQAMLFHNVTEPDEVFAHAFELVMVHQRLGRLSLPWLGQFPLGLQNSQPAGIEFVPKLQSLAVHALIVTN
jgi:hypothetical protein